MTIGTRSVLYGAHCFFVHPWFVALAWWRLYGFPWDPRLWVTFFIHDLGYLGKSNMDGEEGEQHPYWAANFVRRHFDRLVVDKHGQVEWATTAPGNRTWWDFVALHSRFLAKRHGEPYSHLCVADKLAVALEPWWLYLPRVIATGEVDEYMERVQAGREGAKYSTMNLDLRSRRAWFASVQEYLHAWAQTHRDGRPDTWTPGATHG